VTLVPHALSIQSIVDRYRSDPVNAVFASKMEKLNHEPSIREEGIFRESVDNKISQRLNVSDETEALVIKRTLLGNG
jgi:hypothetical protein